MNGECRFSASGMSMPSLLAACCHCCLQTLDKYWGGKKKACGWEDELVWFGGGGDLKKKNSELVKQNFGSWKLMDGSQTALPPLVLVITCRSLLHCLSLRLLDFPLCIQPTTTPHTLSSSSPSSSTAVFPSSLCHLNSKTNCCCWFYESLVFFFPLAFWMWIC